MKLKNTFIGILLLSIVAILVSNQAHRNAGLSAPTILGLCSLIVGSEVVAVKSQWLGLLIAIAAHCVFLIKYPSYAAPILFIWAFVRFIQAYPVKTAA